MTTVDTKLMWSTSALCSLLVNSDCLKALEVGSRDVLDKSVQMRLIILSALAGKTDADAVRGVLHTTAPEELVHGGVNADILGVHGLLSELPQSTESLRGTLLELTVKHQRKKKE